MIKDEDLQIITYLRQNARTTITYISKMTGIPISTIFEKIKSNQKGMIVKHIALLDFEKLGYSARAEMVIRVDKTLRDALSDFLLKHKSVNSVYKITNGYDFLIEVVFENLLEFEKFSELLEEKFKVKQKQVYFITDDIKREGFMANPENFMLGV